MLVLSTSVHAYIIRGEYATLISCNWEQYNDGYGYIGIYDVIGKRYKVFFGNNYCQY